MNDTMVNNETGRFEWSWNSSASFLYGGLAPIFGVIGLALVVVVCSRCRRSESETQGETNVWRGVTTTAQVDEGPNILVIVAGEHHPTHLAKPLPSTHNQGEGRMSLMGMVEAPLVILLGFCFLYPTITTFTLY